MTESVDKTGGDEIFDSLAFFLSEASVMFVILGSGEIERSVGSVEIATDDDRFVGFEGLEKTQKGRIPQIFAEFEAGEIALAVGGVDIDKIKLRKFYGLYATLGEWAAVTIFVPKVAAANVFGEIIKDIDRLYFGESGSARITGAFGAVPEFEVGGVVDFGLAGLGLGFLDAEDIGLFGI